MTLAISTEGLVSPVASGGSGVGPATIAFSAPTPNTTPGAAGGFPSDYPSASRTPIVVQVTDTDGAGAIAFVWISAIFIGGAMETIFRDDAFVGLYVTGSTESSISDGIEFSIARDLGWPGASVSSNLAVGLAVDVVTTDGTLYSASAFYEMPTATPVLPPYVPPPSAGAIDQVALGVSRLAMQFQTKLVA